MQNPYPDEPKIQKDRQMYCVGLPRPKAGVVDQGTTNLVCRRHEFGMGHLRDPAACYLASTPLAYRRLRPKSVHTCSCRCEHKGFAVSTQLLRLHLPVKCEQRILNQRSPRTISVSKHRSDSAQQLLSSPQITYSLSHRHPTARTRQPATDGGRADRADKARIRVRLLACCAVAAIPPAP